MKCGFFYGLFMDVGLLKDMQLEPEPIGPAVLRNYDIRMAPAPHWCPRRALPPTVC